MRDAETGWLTRDDCDGMIWAGQYGASRNVIPGVNIMAAEYPEAGKWSRRPFPACWDGSDQGAPSTWSRDQAVAGLIPYALQTNQRSIIDDHIAYGENHVWKMGDPLADGRVIYTPALIGLVYKIRHAMGGTSSVNEAWPDIYPGGLTDYEANLQVMTIWLQGRAADMLGDDSAKPVPTLPGSHLLDISEVMYQRLQDHATDEPNDPWFNYVYGKYRGNLSHTIDLLMDPAMPHGGYVRCNKPEQCVLASWLFTASNVLDTLGAN